MVEDGLMGSMAFSQRPRVVGCNTTEERDVVRHNGGRRAMGGPREIERMDELVG